MHTLWLATQRGFRNFLWALAWMGAACTQAQSWPERPVKIVVSAAAGTCLLYTSPSPRDRQKSRMPSSA